MHLIEDSGRVGSTGPVARTTDNGDVETSRGEDGEAALAELRSVVEQIGPAVVAFSGGADSSFLAYVATETLGADRVVCATAVSPSLAPEELADCRALAQEWSLRAIEVQTDELTDPAYAVNDGQRCYRCKASLMEALAPIASVGRSLPGSENDRVAAGVAGVAGAGMSGDGGRTGEGSTILLGVNLDDLGDFRPGQVAARERGARFPLVEAGFTKSMVRAASRRLGLRTWDKPAAACLASRIPYGTPVTVGTLRSVTEAESGLRRLGFRQLRVRHYGDTARIEVPSDELATVVSHRGEVTAAVHAAGYRYVTLDLDGFRSGNLNQALDTPRPGVSS